MMNRKYLLGAMLGAGLFLAACSNVCKVETGGIAPGTPEDFKANVPDRVFFDFDSAKVTPAAMKRIEAQATWLNTYSSTKATIEGHTDSRGTAEYNLALGQSRANAAQNALEGQGIDKSRTTTVSYGKERLENLGTTEADHAQNRRAVTVIEP